jgi:chloramphenicol O-acetyltransferase
MVATIYLYNSLVITVIWEQKTNILSGVFLALAIYSYFYRRIKIKHQITRLRKQALLIDVITNSLIAMSENDKFTVKEIVTNMSQDFKEFKTEVREDIKQLIKEFHVYKSKNDKRISVLEGTQKLTIRTIAIYVGFFGAFIMLVINTYMQFKG